jgi:hypothetical protein
MSAGQFDWMCALYAVISHVGGGPHSAHYYTQVNTADGRLHEANNETTSFSSLTRTMRATPSRSGQRPPQLTSA